MGAKSAGNREKGQIHIKMSSPAIVGEFAASSHRTSSKLQVFHAQRELLFDSEKIPTQNSIKKKTVSTIYRSLETQDR